MMRLDVVPLVVGNRRQPLFRDPDWKVFKPFEGRFDAFISNQPNNGFKETQAHVNFPYLKDYARQGLFKKLPEFNWYLVHLYKNRGNKVLAELYPEIINWFEMNKDNI
jgi:hypothetical protein